LAAGIDIIANQEILILLRLGNRINTGNVSAPPAGTYVRMAP
jgi:hypothetical protein